MSIKIEIKNKEGRTKMIEIQSFSNEELSAMEFSVAIEYLEKEKNKYTNNFFK